MTASGSANDWLTPDWPAPAGVRAVCTTRSGGCSQAPYDSLNLGTHVGDDPTQVLANRAVVQGYLGKARAVFLEQVHGIHLQALTPQTPDGSVADVAWTCDANLACTVMVADCLPVLFTVPDGSQVAAAHAGWRGLLGQGGVGVLEVACAQMAAQSRAPSQVMAWLGPCIGPQAFEVGAEVRQAFLEVCAADGDLFAPTLAGKWLANLPGLAHRRLARLGVSKIYGNDGSQPWCTVSNPSRFFSHRRDRVSGRMAASIWRTG